MTAYLTLMKQSFSSLYSNSHSMLLSLNTVPLELYIVLSTMLGYFVLAQVRSRHSRHRSSYSHAKSVSSSSLGSLASCKQAEVGKAKPHIKVSEDVAPASAAEIESALLHALDAKDHRAVVRHWTMLEDLGRGHYTQLPRVIEAMHRCGRDTPSIVRELHDFFQKHTDECNVNHINHILETLDVTLHPPVAKGILGMLPSLHLTADHQTYETALKFHVATDFREVQRLVVEMESRAMALTARSTYLVMKAALHANNFSWAHIYLKKLKALWQVTDTSEPFLPLWLLKDLVRLACRTNQLETLLSEIEGEDLPQEVRDMIILHDCTTSESEIDNSPLERAIRFVISAFEKLAEHVLAAVTNLQTLIHDWSVVVF